MANTEELNIHIKKLQLDWKKQVEKKSKCSENKNCELHFCNRLAEKYENAVSYCEKFFEDENFEYFIESLIDLGFPLNELGLTKYITDPKFKIKVCVIGGVKLEKMLAQFEETLEEIYANDF